MSGVSAPSFAAEFSQLLKETLFNREKFLSIGEMGTQQIGIATVDRQTEQAKIIVSPDQRGLISRLISWRHSTKPLPSSTIFTALLSHIYTGAALTLEPARRLFEAIETDPQALPELVSLIEAHLLTTQILQAVESRPLADRLIDDPRELRYVTLTIDQHSVEREGQTSLAALIRKERCWFFPHSFVEKDVQTFLDHLESFITKPFTDQICLLLQAYLASSEQTGEESWTPELNQLQICPLENTFTRIQYHIKLTGKQPQNRAEFLVWLTVSNRGLLRKIEVYLSVQAGIVKVDDDFPFVWECTSAWLARCAFIRPALDALVDGLIKRLSTIVVYEGGQAIQGEIWLKEKLHVGLEEKSLALILHTRLQEVDVDTVRILGVCLACSEQIQQFATESLHSILQEEWAHTLERIQIDSGEGDETRITQYILTVQQNNHVDPVSIPWRIQTNVDRYGQVNTIQIIIDPAKIEPQTLSSLQKSFVSTWNYIPPPKQTPPSGNSRQFLPLSEGKVTFPLSSALSSFDVSTFPGSSAGAQLQRVWDFHKEPQKALGSHDPGAALLRSVAIARSATLLDPLKLFLEGLIRELFHSRYQLSFLHEEEVRPIDHSVGIARTITTRVQETGCDVVGRNFTFSKYDIVWCLRVLMDGHGLCYYASYAILDCHLPPPLLEQCTARFQGMWSATPAHVMARTLEACTDQDIESSLRLIRQRLPTGNSPTQPLQGNPGDIEAIQASLATLRIDSGSVVTTLSDSGAGTSSRPQDAAESLTRFITVPASPQAKRIMSMGTHRFVESVQQFVQERIGKVIQCEDWTYSHSLKVKSVAENYTCTLEGNYSCAAGRINWYVTSTFTPDHAIKRVETGVLSFSSSSDKTEEGTKFCKGFSRCYEPAATTTSLLETVLPILPVALRHSFAYVNIPGEAFNEGIEGKLFHNAMLIANDISCLGPFFKQIGEAITAQSADRSHDEAWSWTLNPSVALNQSGIAITFNVLYTLQSTVLSKKAASSTINRLNKFECALKVLLNAEVGIQIIFDKMTLPCLPESLRSSVIRLGERYNLLTGLQVSNIVVPR